MDITSKIFFPTLSRLPGFTLKLHLHTTSNERSHYHCTMVIGEGPGRFAKAIASSLKAWDLQTLFRNNFENSRNYCGIGNNAGIIARLYAGIDAAKTRGGVWLRVCTMCITSCRPVHIACSSPVLSTSSCIACSLWTHQAMTSTNSNSDSIGTETELSSLSTSLAVVTPPRLRVFLIHDSDSSLNENNLWRLWNNSIDFGLFLENTG